MTSKLIEQAREQMRKQVRGRVQLVKDAAEGSLDQPFEQAFAGIANAYLADRSPALLEYLLGFQLVDRNEAGDKAIGVFGFKVGSQLLLAPVFWLKGDIKGKELLYLKSSDQFVPMEEGWVNYIIHKRQPVLGNSVTRNLQEIGVMPPHLYQLSRSPNKFASAPLPEKFNKLSAWAKPVVATMAKLATSPLSNDPKYSDITNLPTFLKEAGREVITRLIHTFIGYPQVKKAFAEFHDLSIISDAIAAVKQAEAEAASNSVLKDAACKMTEKGVRCVNTKKPPQKSVIAEPTSDVIEPIKAAAVAFLTYEAVAHSGTMFGKLKGLSSKEREKLLKDKVLVKDERPPHSVSRVYELQTTLSVRNPDTTGIYDVLVSPGSFEKCLIVVAPYSNRRRQLFCTVVRLDGDNEKSWMNIHPSCVWIKDIKSDEYFRDWVHKLDSADDLSESETPLLIINAFGNGTVPIEVDTELSGTDGNKAYHAYFRDNCYKERAGYLPKADHNISHDLYGQCDTGCELVLTGKDSTWLRVNNRTLYIPNNCYKLKLKKGYGDHSEGESPIRPGDMLDIDNLIGQKATTMKVASFGDEVTINNGHRMTKLAALKNLICDHGINEKQARTILNRADVDKVFKCRIKYADQYYDQQKSGPNAPGFPEPYIGTDALTGGNVPTMTQSEFNIKVPDMSSAKTDRMQYQPMGPDTDYQQGSKDPPQPDQNAQRMAVNASKTGQKEIFDTAVIGSLLKATNDDNLVDKYLGDLMKGMDRLGRVLFLFYWHNEAFADRYGQADMVELEDGLRNAFEDMGDLVLFLKQRGIDPHPDDTGSPDLGAAAN